MFAKLIIFLWESNDKNEEKIYELFTNKKNA